MKLAPAAHEITLDGYQEKIWDFAKYPNPGTNLDYPTDGLVGEVGELLTAHHISWNGSPELILSELGDVLWYLAATLRTLGIGFNDFAMTLPSARWRTIPLTVQIAAEAMLVKNLTKKIARDDAGEITTDAKVKLIKQLGLFFALLLEYMDRFSIDLEDVLRHNLAKLEGRQSRGTLNGSGDDR